MLVKALLPRGRDGGPTSARQGPQGPCDGRYHEQGRKAASETTALTLLLAAGADATLKTNKGNTAALGVARGHVHVVEKGADERAAFERAQSLRRRRQRAALQRQQVAPAEVSLEAARCGRRRQQQCQQQGGGEKGRQDGKGNGSSAQNGSSAKTAAAPKMTAAPAGRRAATQRRAGTGAGEDASAAPLPTGHASPATHGGDHPKR